MRKYLALFLILGPAAGLAVAADDPELFDAKRARVYKAAPGESLTAVSRAAAKDVVAGFLRTRGVSEATVRSLKAVAEQRASTGLTHVRLEQHVAGLRVEGAYVKAALDGSGRLVHLIENLAGAGGRVAAASVDERQALRAALAALYPAAKEDPASLSREGNTTRFARTAFFHAAPRVERVAVAMKGGALEAGHLVETWRAKDNLLHETLVGGNGRVLAVELRTNTDSYNIFPEHPADTPQQVVAGPGTWLFAVDHTTIDIAGNNAHAYLDTNANNAPDAGGTVVSDGNFLTAANLGQSPSTADNRNVAVQNLFYFNNVIHDQLYGHGFTEAAGNFQENNFGLGGRGSDSVNAEAQDGAGTDNANFATPRDGQNPRMQMFLWTGKPSHEVEVGPTIYSAAGAAFGPALAGTGVTAVIEEAADATAPTTDGCETITTDLTGKIALIDRGTCTFVVKVKNVQNAGAIGAIVVNNQGDTLLTMGGTDATITIPSVFVGQTDGNAIRGVLPFPGTIRLKDPPALQRDGDLDSDIIWHEYGHGLTWRMIGRMSGALAGAIGEGMSDVLAILANGDDVVAEYSFSDPIGIRSAPYTNYGRTYGDVAGTSVHFDGEVYAAIGWRLRENFLGAFPPLTTDLLLDYMVDGMNFTPAQPSYEEMRDGILQSVANSGSGHDCLVWDAFADYGVGVGAQGRTRGPTVLVTESFALPDGCTEIP